MSTNSTASFMSCLIQHGAHLVNYSFTYSTTDKARYPIGHASFVTASGSDPLLENITSMEDECNNLKPSCHKAVGVFSEAMYVFTYTIIADVSAKFHLTVTDIVVWSKVIDCFSLVFHPPLTPTLIFSFHALTLKVQLLHIILLSSSFTSIWLHHVVGVAILYIIQLLLKDLVPSVLKYTQSPPFLTAAGGSSPSELSGHFSQNLQQKLVHVPTSQAYSDFSLHNKQNLWGNPILFMFVLLWVL